MTFYLSFVPYLFFILWIAIIVYAVVLGTRLVRAVEQIARVVSERNPDLPRA